MEKTPERRAAALCRNPNIVRDMEGRISAVTCGDEVTRFGYDTCDRLDSMVDESTDVGPRARFQYFGYDGQCRFAFESDEVLDSSGRSEGGFSVIEAQDARGTLRWRSTSTSEPRQDGSWDTTRSCKWDEAGRIIAIEDMAILNACFDCLQEHGAGEVWEYSYDEHGRLTQWIRMVFEGPDGWSFDPELVTYEYYQDGTLARRCWRYLSFDMVCTFWGRDGRAVGQQRSYGWPDPFGPLTCWDECCIQSCAIP